MMKRRTIMTLLFCFLPFLGSSCATTDPAVTRKKIDALEQLGNSLVREGDLQGGLKELLQASALDPESPSIHNALGYTFHAMREFDRALFHYKRALELKPDFPEALNNLGTVYTSMGRWDQAIEAFQKAADNMLYRTRHYAFENLGSAFHNKGEYRKAIENYKKALTFFPEYLPAYQNMGISYEMLQEWELAIESYKKAIVISPTFPATHLSLGTLYLRLNRFQEAREELLATINADTTGEYSREARRLLNLIQTTR